MDTEPVRVRIVPLTTNSSPSATNEKVAKEAMNPGSASRASQISGSPMRRMPPVNQPLPCGRESRARSRGVRGGRV